MIAIIAILASLLLPALSRAKSAADSTKCKSNLRHLAIALQNYANDAEAYPLHSFITTMGPPQQFTRWHTDLKPYLGQDWFDPLYQCPANKSRVPPSISASGSSFGGYGYNDRGVASEFWSSLGLGGWSTIGEGHPCRESMVRIPSDMIAMGDCVLGGTYASLLASPAQKFVGGSDRFSIAEWRNVDKSLRPLAMQKERQRHSGKYNVAFCDGHLENLKTNALFSTNTTVLQRWNNDNEPHRDQLP